MFLQQETAKKLILGSRLPWGTLIVEVRTLQILNKEQMSSWVESSHFKVHDICRVLTLHIMSIDHLKEDMLQII